MSMAAPVSTDIASGFAENNVRIKKGMKVLVHSRYREVRAMVARAYRTNPVTQRTEMVPRYRTFVDHRAYCTPEEAAFLVESEENQRHIEYGLPAPYSYPAGMPFPVDVNKDGPFYAAEGDAAIMSHDPRAALGADKIREEMAAFEAAQKPALPTTTLTDVLNDTPPTA